MFIRVLRDSLFRQKRRKAVVLLAVALGTASAAALADIALDVGDKMNRELKAFGANLVVVPRESARPVRIAGEDLSRLRPPSYLSQDQLRKVKDNFWKNNILSLAPVLDLTARVNGHEVPLAGTWFEREAAVDSEGREKYLAGVRSLNPFWSVKGDWPADLTAEDRRAMPVPALVGTRRAAALGVRPGDRITSEGAAGSATRPGAGNPAHGGARGRAILPPGVDGVG